MISGANSCRLVAGNKGWGTHCTFFTFSLGVSFLGYLSCNLAQGIRMAICAVMRHLFPGCYTTSLMHVMTLSV